MPSGFSTSPSYYVGFLQQFAVRRCPRDTPPSQDVDGWTSITSKGGSPRYLPPQTPWTHVDRHV